MHSKLALISGPLLLILALAHQHGARAQFGQYGIPPCATACMEQAAIQGRCGFTDMACICTALSDTAVLGTAIACEKAYCPQTTTTTATTATTQTGSGDAGGGAGTAFERFVDGFCQVSR